MRRWPMMATAILALAPIAASSAQQRGGRPGGAPPADVRGGGGPMGGMQTDGMGMRGAMGGGAAMMDPAGFLLARTGVLKLTDAQVTRLAAIARRADDRRRAMRTSIDSMRPACAPMQCDSAARAQARSQMARRATEMRTTMQRMQEQMRADRRDAIAVLTPDQQGQAWEMVAATSRGGRPGLGRGRMRQRRGFDGGRQRRPGGPDDRGPNGRMQPRQNRNGRGGAPGDGPDDAQDTPPASPPS